MGILSKIFGDANEKYLKRLSPLINNINELEESVSKLSNSDFANETEKLKERLDKGEALDDILSEAFALVREASKRVLKQRHYDVQLIGGIIMHQGKIAEMRTGEGKTLSATLPAYLNALQGKGVHVITVNDYLSRRDAVWMGQIFHLLGLSTGCIIHQQSFLYDPEFKEADESKDEERDILGGFRVVQDYLRPCSRKEAYSADITYGTNNEFGFDFLKDNMVYNSEQQVQRGFNYAIIDEVDSILIDEARTPLIISVPETNLMSAEEWREEKERYYFAAKIADQLKKEVDYLLDEKQKTFEWTEEGQEKLINLLGKDPWAEVMDPDKKKIDNAIKAKEFFLLDRDYIIKDGKVMIIDEFTGRLMTGRRWSGEMHQSNEAKKESRKRGADILPLSLTLASITFQNFFRMYEKLSGMTGTAITSAEEFDKVYGLDVVIVPTNKPMIRIDMADKVYKTEAGKLKAVVEDIKIRNEKGQPILLGTTSIEKNEVIGKMLEREGISHRILNAKNHEKEGEIIAQAGKFGSVTIATNMAGRGVDIVLGGNPSDDENAKKVIEAGGLHVIGTERHEARRIDNQLRGRSGRQGDIGSSQFYISLEDDLLRIFGGDKLKNMMEFLKLPEDQAIEAKMVSGVIESAQNKIEGAHFDSRKYLLDYDDVVNKHRETLYKKRKEILTSFENGTLRDLIVSFIEKQGRSKEDYFKKDEEIGAEKMREVEKIVCLKTIDSLWIDHLEDMEIIRDSVRLRAYGGQDPLIEYKNEGHRAFQNLLRVFEKNVVEMLFRATPISNTTSPQRTVTVSSFGKKQKVGRNDPCPCGSGKKYKKCCGK